MGHFSEASLPVTLTQKTSQFESRKSGMIFHPIGKEVCREDKQVSDRADGICHQTTRVGHAARRDLLQFLGVIQIISIKPYAVGCNCGLPIFLLYPGGVVGVINCWLGIKNTWVKRMRGKSGRKKTHCQ